MLFTGLLNVFHSSFTPFDKAIEKFCVSFLSTHKTVHNRCIDVSEITYGRFDVLRVKTYPVSSTCFKRLDTWLLQVLCLRQVIESAVDKLVLNKLWPS